MGDALEFNAGGWSSSPIIIQEGDASEEIAKWSVVHEAGHRAFKFADIDDDTNIMHYQQSWKNYRLRYCPRKRHYDTGTENQWETISRIRRDNEEEEN